MSHLRSSGGRVVGSLLTWGAVFFGGEAISQSHRGEGSQRSFPLKFQLETFWVCEENKDPPQVKAPPSSPLQNRPLVFVFLVFTKLVSKPQHTEQLTRKEGALISKCSLHLLLRNSKVTVASLMSVEERKTLLQVAWISRKFTGSF